MKKKILLVDDEATSTMFLSAYLEDQNFEVRTSTNGEEAIAIGKEFKPEVLISDWMLKDRKDGIDVAEELVVELPELKIIFVSGMAPEALQDKITSGLQCTILEKPINLEKILQLVEAP